MAHDSGSKTFDLKAMLRDERFWKIAFQVITLIVVLLLLSFFLGNLNRNLIQQGRAFGFSFLRNPAGFSIGESLIQYRPNDPYWRALMVGLGNTLTLVVGGIVLTTLLGVVAGVASFSKNWLLQKLSRLYVGLVQNIPLLLQLFFWYFAIFGALPRPEAQIGVLGLAFLNNRGVYIPWASSALLAVLGIAATVGAAIAALYLWRWRTKIRIETGVGGQAQSIALAVVGLVWLAIITLGMDWTIPEGVEGGGVTGGLRLSREYVASLTALVFYTSAFVAEIVRAGIQSVSKGQWEAARTLGLNAGMVMRLVVFPQALRVIIPPMNSQYMNLTKNSSLAFAIAFPEIYSIATTTYNQTGRPVEVFVVMMATYLTLCLLITVVMNQFNRSVQFKER
ncbi:amino acid ABC transporter permease [Phormidium tenue]|uniref:Amino acid ABC transporter permease n=1 Tax=Phormidium tenue NIES-30 TaxID=549789 RepID=A0A1U7JAH5_9CYAN|nr:ABC transporter permease subunit [Phormidium tenue]MBD2230425.1 ABC transporter permease subunit [Phormidium tenue FACHB-1052]OKH50784.1 amino acid ABC transporter permease [Phormidium tenue NIES-30]